MRILFIVMLIFIIGSCKKTETSNLNKDFKQEWDTLRVLKNPGKGWYHHLLDNGTDHYAIKNDSVFAAFPAMDHLYLRLAWSYLEPKEGQFDWHRIDEIVEKYVPLGYGISFRISSKETGTFPETVNDQVNGVQYATPSWVEKAGAIGTVAEVWNVKSWTPDWDDSVYLEKLDNFHKAFAARYDGKTWLRYVDIGSIGEWGEGHTFFSTKVPPTVQDVMANIDIFVKNYSKSQLVCCDDLIYYEKKDADVKTLYNYAISKGISLRDDSPLVEGYLQNNLKTWTVSHPQFYDPLYLKKPIVFELQHYGSVKKEGNWLGKNGESQIPKYGYSGAEIMRNAIETMHATYIGYHGYAEEWLADNPDLTNELANLCGYWYFPVGAKFEDKMSHGINNVSIEWLNKGIAPAYKKFEIVFRLTDAETKQNSNILIEDSGNLNFMPKSNNLVPYSVNIPENIKKGNYLLKFKLQLSENGAKTPIDIGLKKSMFDTDGFAELGRVTIK